MATAPPATFAGLVARISEPGGDFGGDLTFMHSLVREHGLADHVADGENVNLVGAHLSVDRDKPTLVDDNTGILRTDYARQFGAGGYVGRASGRAFDARKAFRYAPYD